MRCRAFARASRPTWPVPVGARRARETVLATLVRLLDTTFVRVGNDEYARSNSSFGLTTLRNRHAGVRGSPLRLRFRGKGGVEHEVALDDPRVARVVRRCQAMPGQELFQYQDETAQRRGIGSSDVNDYLRAPPAPTSPPRTSAPGTARARARPAGRQQRPRRRANDERQPVARRGRQALGNTVAVCSKSYVHPRVLEALAAVDAATDAAFARLATQRRRAGLTPPSAACSPSSASAERAVGLRPLRRCV